MKANPVRLLSFLVTLNIVICTAAKVGMATQPAVSDLETEERLFLAMIDKTHNRGYEAYQTPAGLQQFQIQFWIDGKYELVVAEADKILQKYPDELHYRVNAFEDKHRALLALGKVEQAQMIYEAAKNDHRRCSFGFRTSLALFVKYLMAQNVMSLKCAMLDFDGALEVLEDMRRVAGEIQNDCDPNWASAAEYYAGANIDFKIGDIYRLWGKYNTAAVYYQKALDYMVTHAQPSFRKGGGSERDYVKKRDGGLAALIAECKTPADKVTDILALKRNVDYKLELAQRCRQLHCFGKADMLQREILEYLSSNPLPVSLSGSERSRYEKIHNTIIQEGSLEFKANVEHWLNQAEFCAFFFGPKEKQLSYYQKALDYLRAHPVPTWLSEEKKAHYAELATHVIPEKIAELTNTGTEGNQVK